MLEEIFKKLETPNEKQEDIFKTIAMNKLCKTDIQSVCKFYPYQISKYQENTGFSRHCQLQDTINRLGFDRKKSSNGER